MNTSADQAQSRMRRELDLARLALHLREALRAARRLGLDRQELRIEAPRILPELLRVTEGLESVPELKLTETPLASRVSLFDLYALLRDELLGLGT